MGGCLCRLWCWFGVDLIFLFALIGGSIRLFDVVLMFGFQVGRPIRLLQELLLLGEVFFRFLMEFCFGLRGLEVELVGKEGSRSFFGREFEFNMDIQ